MKAANGPSVAGEAGGLTARPGGRFGGLVLPPRTDTCVTADSGASARGVAGGSPKKWSEARVGRGDRAVERVESVDVASIFGLDALLQLRSRGNRGAIMSASLLAFG
eukprot:1368839-Pleurochrysis_carterae.AAC.2